MCMPTSRLGSGAAAPGESLPLLWRKAPGKLGKERRFVGPCERVQWFHRISYAMLAMNHKFLVCMLTQACTSEATQPDCLLPGTTSARQCKLLTSFIIALLSRYCAFSLPLSLSLFLYLVEAEHEKCVARGARAHG